MKKLLLMILAFSLIGASDALSQESNLSKQQRKANKKLEKEKREREQNEKDIILYNKALIVLENNQWAFESNRMTDSNGRPIDLPNNRPNVAGFDGKTFFAEIIHFYNAGGREDVRAYFFDSKGEKESSKIDKKGNHVYKFRSYPPTPCEATLVLYKNSNKASLTISGPVTASYVGSIIDIKDSWWFMTYEQKQKK